jgi:hypothetical protein
MGLSHFIVGLLVARDSASRLQDGASDFFRKVSQEIGCDTGSAATGWAASNPSRSALVPRLGFFFPVGDMQGYIRFKGYKEFTNL